MIKKNGKTYVIIEFSDEADAAYFETAMIDRHQRHIGEAAVEGRLKDDAFAAEDEVNSTNVASGVIHGGLFQVGHIAGKRVQ